MTPEERCYKILQDSKYIRTPDENPSVIIETFIESGQGCAWLYPETKIEKRIFETIFKCHFEQYKEELINFAKNNPPTFSHSYGSIMKMDVGLHTVDDQGFEGQVMSDHTFHRWIDDQ